MKITIIGASAGIGRLAVEQALESGHRVTALARDPTPLADHPQLTKIAGNATHVEDLKKAIGGADAVLITIGTKSKKATTLFSDTAKALLEATAGTAFTVPVLVVTGFGVGASAAYLNWWMRPVVKWLLKEQTSDKVRLQELLAASPLNWEIIQPGVLTNGPLTENYKAFPNLFKGMKIGLISRADVADFMLREAKVPTMLHKYVALQG